MNRKLRLIVWWRKQSVSVRLFVTSFLGLLFFGLLYLQRPADDISQVGSNLLVFILVNLIIMVLCLLAFLIGRNVVKLVFDRRRNILGSKLRMRLVMAFVSLTLVPTVIIFVLASGLLSSAMEGWFGDHMESVFNGAIEIAKHQNLSLKEEVEKDTTELKSAINRYSSVAELAVFLEKFRESRQLSSITLFNETKENIVKIESATSVIDNFKEPEIQAVVIDKVLQAKSGQLLIEEKEASEFVRQYSHIRFQNSPAVMVLSKRIDPELSHAMNLVNESYKEFEQVQLFRGPLKSAYLMTLAVITGLILFSAIWFGFYMAKELSVPIQKLAEGTRAVSKGNYDFRVRELGDDEMAFLIRSFNAMTQDIKSSRQDVEKQRVYVETILASLAVGVISADVSENIISINPSASRLFKIEKNNLAVGRNVKEILGDEAYGKLRPVLEQVESKIKEGPEVRETEIIIKSGDEELRVLCTVGRVLDKDNKTITLVLIFDDITELVKAQHMSAWREVARRVAHEIKNPLTPIQLSAQRLQKLLGDKEGIPAVNESTNTILENVDSIKRLTDEFSKFARMPTAEFRDCDLNNLISSCIAPFADSHNEITFQFIADNKLPQIKADVEQIRRVVINLLDNAIAATDTRTDKQERGRIVIKTFYNHDEGRFQIEISDTGAGIPDNQKLKIFEPYFTTKISGTGLGLAIVSSIISDHEGTIKVFDNHPKGARFVVDMPVTTRHNTQRKFASQV